MPRIQEWIYALEEGRGTKIIKYFLCIVGFIALAIVYNYFCFKNFYAPEAMDSAQLSRNLSEGKGYTTDNIRPLSIHLLQKHRADRDPLLKTAHPDLANPPVYPAFLAAVLKVAPVKYPIAPKKAFTSYQPERWIAGANQFLFLCAALLVFLIADRLFNPTAAWVSVLVLAGTELLWQFSVSGLSTMLLIVLVLGVVFCLVRMDEWQAEDSPPNGKLVGVGLLIGVLIGLAGLTRYSFLWLILPTLLFVVLFIARYRMKVSAVILLSFLIVVTPWIIRNVKVSGTWFGLSTYAVVEGTPAFRENILQRSLNPDFSKVTVKNIASKLFSNTHDILRNQISSLGSSWVTTFFLAGLLLPFRNPTASRLRMFLLSTLVLFVAVQALSRTNLSDVSRNVNSENLLIVFAPVVFIFGVAFFLALIDLLKLANPLFAKGISVAFLFIVSLPLFFALMAPDKRALAYPPYHPPLIQEASSWMKEGELIMSDLPWAVAWYGDRQCVGLTLDRDKQFFAIDDDMKRVQALYLSPQITDSRFLSQIMQPKSWEQLAFQGMARGSDGLEFPLKSIREDLVPQHIFLADWERWKMSRK